MTNELNKSVAVLKSVCNSMDKHDLVRIIDSGEGIDVELEDLKSVVEAAGLVTELVEWIETKCQPNANFTGQGHNMCMSQDDRDHANNLLTRANQILGEKPS